MATPSLSVFSTECLWQQSNLLISQIEAAETRANATGDNAVRKLALAYADKLDKEHAKVAAELRRRGQ
jgi:hypothetical protein